MKKLLLLLMFILTNVYASAQLIYAPYYVAMGSMRNGKISWGKYCTVRSSSIFANQGTIEFNFPDSPKITLYGATNNRRKAKSKQGVYYYYKNLRTKNGSFANMRVDFTGDWVIFSVYIPEMPAPNNCFNKESRILSPIHQALSSILLCISTQSQTPTFLLRLSLLFCTQTTF